MTTNPAQAIEARSIRDWMLAARHTSLGLATAVSLTAAGFMLRPVMSPLLEDRLAFLIFMPAVIGAAALGGAPRGRWRSCSGLPVVSMSQARPMA